MRKLLALHGLQPSDCRIIEDDSPVDRSTGFPETSARQVLSFCLDQDDKGIVPKQAEPNVKGVGQMIAIMARAGVIHPPLPAPERFVDLHYLEAAGIR